MLGDFFKGLVGSLFDQKQWVHMIHKDNNMQKEILKGWEYQILDKLDSYLAKNGKLTLDEREDLIRDLGKDIKKLFNADVL